VTCGLPLERYEATCGACPPPVVWRSRSAFWFGGAARSAIHRLKYAGWRPVAAALASAMTAAAEGFGEADAITWVPLSRRRRAGRGFDQAELLARAVAIERGRRATPLLERVADTAPQAKRGAAERRVALRRSFAVVRPPPAGVLLIDDVVTTGSTAAACASALVRAGAERVALLTAARSVSSRLPRRYTRAGLAPGSVVARGIAPR
jgi:ComF family protein